MLKLRRIAVMELLKVVHDLGEVEALLDGFTHVVELDIKAWPAGWDTHLAGFADVHVGCNVYLASGDMAELDKYRADWVGLELKPIVQYVIEPVPTEEAMTNWLPKIDSMLEYLEKHWAGQPINVKISDARKQFTKDLTAEWERLELPWSGQAYNLVHNLISNSSQYKKVNAEVVNAWAWDLTQHWL